MAGARDEGWMGWMRIELETNEAKKGSSNGERRHKLRIVPTVLL